MTRQSTPMFEVPASITAARARERARRISEHAGIMTCWWNFEAHLLGVAAQARYLSITLAQLVALVQQAWAQEVVDPAGIAPSSQPEQEPVTARLARLRGCVCRVVP